MTSQTNLTGLLAIIAALFILAVFVKCIPYLVVKSRFLKRMNLPAAVLPCNPGDNAGFDAASFQAHEQVLKNSGFRKLGEGELVTAARPRIPNFFMFFSHPQMHSVCMVRQVFAPNHPSRGVQISIATRTAEGGAIVTRNVSTYAGLGMPQEIVETVSSGSLDEIIQKHFQRLSMLQAAPLPASTTLEGCINLLNERRKRQARAIQDKSVLSMALSFFRWRRTLPRRVS